MNLDWLESIHLGSGAHQSVSDGVCAMEAAAYLAGEPHSDAPQCVSPVIAAFLRSWNDALPDDETRDRLLKPLLPRVLNTRSTPDIEHQRSLMALDWLIWTHTAAWLDMVDALKPHAAALRKAPVVTDENAQAVGKMVRAAEYTARAADEDTAWAAARAAAQVAAGDATWAADAETVAHLQESAVTLVEAMCDIGRLDEERTDAPAEGGNG